MVESRTKARYLSVLGLPEEAGFRDVQAAFRRLVLKYHPDVNRGKNAAFLFRDIIEAYNGLLDILMKVETKSGERISTGIRKDPLIRGMRLEELEERVRYSTSPQVRRSAVMAIGMHGGVEAKKILLRAIKDPDPDVQSTALAALGGMCGVKDGGRILVSILHARRSENLLLFVKTAFGAVRRGSGRLPFLGKGSSLRRTTSTVRGWNED
jgi:HEAT repeat protein